MGTDAWDHDGFYKNVIARAKRLGIATSTPSLATAANISHGMLSKWYRGQERPSPKSLKKLSDILTLPEERADGKSAYTEFMVLAGHLEPHQVGMAEAPAPPPAPERDELIVEMEQGLSDSSWLSDEERAVARDLIERVWSGFRRPRRRRSA
jgi:transcriptional regulator with XRE-family HTH domain